LVEPKEAEGMLFEKPTLEMLKHLKSLFTKVSINDKMFNRVIVDVGVILNVVPLLTLKNLGKNMEEGVFEVCTLTNGGFQLKAQGDIRSSNEVLNE
jgi:hypothetical protein